MSVALKSLICFSIGGVALASGAALAPASGVAAGAALGATLSSCLQAIGGSLLANITENLIDRSYSNVQKRLRTQADGGLLPQNHDFFRAVRRSQLHAMLFLVESYSREAKEHLKAGDASDYRDPTKFRQRADTYLKTQLKLADRHDLGFVALDAIEATADVSGLFDTEKSAHQQIEALWTNGRNASWNELETAIGSEPDWPADAFRDWFDGVHGIGYIAAVQQFFAEKLKTDARLQVVVFMDQLSEINAGVEAALDQIAGIDAVLRARFDELEVLLRQGDRLGASDGMADRLLTEVASLPDLKAIRNAVSSLLPDDEDLAKLSATVVRQRISELLYHPATPERPVAMPKFFGRERELRSLDQWLETTDRGLRVLCAPSGSGKSALLAAWARRRTERGDNVARHFVSLELPDTFTPSVTLRHLLDQLRRLDRVARAQTDTGELSAEREIAIRGDEDQLRSTLYGRLCRDQGPEDPKLIVIVDGLDELIKPIESSFVNEDLGKGVYVIVSRRAEPGDEPIDLRTWLKAPAGDDPKHRRIDLAAMQEEDVLLWLEEIIADADEATMMRLAQKLTAVTDGLPLFLQYVIDIELSAIDKVPLQDRVQRVLSLTEPFSGFLKDYIEGRLGTLETHKALSPEQVALFTLLSLTKGPISEKDLKALYQHFATGKSLGAAEIAAMNAGLRRWLSIRQPSDPSVDPTKRIAFDHPRLALEFGNAFRSLKPDQFEAAEETLWSWSMNAWQPSQNPIRKTEKRGAIYAARNAPWHGLAFGELDEVAKILMDDGFIRERFLSFDAADAAFLMARDWTAWDRLRRGLGA